MKKILSISLSKDTIDWITFQVDKGNFRNRSHAVEEAVKELREKKEKGNLKEFI